MPNSLDIKHNLPSDAEAKRMFDAVPILERYKVADKTLREGSKVILTKARQLAPRQTAAKRDLRSSKQRQSADWDTPLWKTVKRVVRKQKRGNGFAVIGPEWPKGNKAYFNTSPAGRKRVLWGKQPKNLSPVAPQVRNWIVKAFDETRSAQLAAMKAKLRTLMREVWE
jgi:hypothetical protein